MNDFVKLLGVAYIVIGCVNSLYLLVTVSINKCAHASGVLAVYCNTGQGISHFVSITLWPLFWLS